jgi:hypothetical protein
MEGLAGEMRRIGWRRAAALFLASLTVSFLGATLVERAVSGDGQDFALVRPATPPVRVADPAGDSGPREDRPAPAAGDDLREVERAAHRRARRQARRAERRFEARRREMRERLAARRTARPPAAPAPTPAATPGSDGGEVAAREEELR